MLILPHVLHNQSLRSHSPTPSRHSFVHQDGGRVVLNELGEIESPHQQPIRWQPQVDSEKQRLYVEARRNAAMTQLSGGADLDSMGLAEEVVPAEPPPEYSPKPTRVSQLLATPPAVIVDPPASGSGNTSNGSRNRSGTVTNLPYLNDPAQTDGSQHGTASPSGSGSGSLAHERTSTRIPSIGLGISNASDQAVRPSSAVGNGDRHQSVNLPVGDDEQRNTHQPAARDRDASPAPLPSPSPRQPTPSSSSGPAANAAAASIQPLSDKEAMKRFYAAQASMANAQSSDKAGGSGSVLLNNQESGASGAPGFMSAAREKDLMKQRYEQATRQVSNHYSPSPIAGPSGSSEEAGPDNDEEGPAASLAAGLSSASRAGDSSDREPKEASRLDFKSAAEEKEMMKRRYEQAARQVSDHYVQSPQVGQAPSDSGEGGSSNNTPTRTDHGTGTGHTVSSTASNHGSSSSGHVKSPAFPSAEEEKEAMRRRYESAVQGVARMNMGQVTEESSEASSSSNSQRALPPSNTEAVPASGPIAPPPVPARPKDDYAALLNVNYVPSPPPMPMPHPYFYGQPMMNPVFPMPPMNMQMPPGFSPPINMSSPPMFGMPIISPSPVGSPVSPHQPMGPYLFGMPMPHHASSQYKSEQDESG